MNFLEAYSELDRLNAAVLQYRIPPKYSFKNTNGQCPRCKAEPFKTKDEYIQHVLKHCNGAADVFAAEKMPARVKMGKEGRSFDILTNITEEDLIDYMCKNQTCEICGSGLGVHPDHRHAKDDSRSGTFRGAICKDCNLLLGSIENNSGKLSYEDYLLKILWYLDRGEDWIDPAKAGFTPPDLMYAENNF